MGLAPTPAVPAQKLSTQDLTAVPRARSPEGPNYLAAILFLLPAAILLIVFLLYPAIYTVLLSFNRGRNGVFEQWVGFDNYIRLFSDPDFINLSTFPPSGALWSIVIFLGLIIAVVAARVRYESVIKAIVFIPMAISATALAVIWKFVYSPDANIGLINAVLGNLGVSPIAWLGDE